MKKTRYLKPIERNIIELLAQGFNNSYIAKTLNYTPATVSCCIHNIYTKLGIFSNDEKFNPRVKIALMFLENKKKKEGI